MARRDIFREIASQKDVDEDMLDALRLFAENTGELYPQKMSIIENLKKKIGSGTYDPTLAPKLWMYWIDEAARRYVKEEGGSVKEKFPRELRERLSAEIARDEEAKIRGGEYGEVSRIRRAGSRDPNRIRGNSLALAKDALSRIGMTITKKDDELRVNFKGGKEATAYYTNDLFDAVQTAEAMVKGVRAIEGGEPLPERVRFDFGKNREIDPARFETWECKAHGLNSDCSCPPANRIRPNPMPRFKNNIVGTHSEEMGRLGETFKLYVDDIEKVSHLSQSEAMREVKRYLAFGSSAIAIGSRGTRIDASVVEPRPPVSGHQRGERERRPYCISLTWREYEGLAFAAPRFAAAQVLYSALSPVDETILNENSWKGEEAFCLSEHEAWAVAEAIEEEDSKSIPLITFNDKLYDQILSKIV